MRIDVLSTYNELNHVDIEKTQAYFVVIDVLRATTTITTALMNGAKEVVFCESLEDLLNKQNEYSSESMIIGGEKDYAKIPGLMLGNSPQSFTPAIVLGKTLLLSTTNGTPAIIKAASKGHVCLACLNNLSTIRDHLLKVELRESRIVIVCAGRNGRFALEDFLCAGMLVEKLSTERHVLEHFSMTDSAFVAKVLYEKYRGAIESGLVQSESGKKLISIGQQLDVDYCAKVDTAFAIPVVKDGVIKLETLVTKKFRRVD